MKYLYYKTDGTRDILETTEPFTLEKLQELVGGNIEGAPIEDDGVRLFVNEDGLAKMLPRNPFFKPFGVPYYVGNIVMGKEKLTESGVEFVGFDDVEEVAKHDRKLIGYDQSIFQAGKIFTAISIGDFKAETTRHELKSTGELFKNVPTFRANVRGAKDKFIYKKLDDPDTLVFEGNELPFKTDSEIAPTKEFVDLTIRGNAMINLAGNPDVIRDWVMHKNLNPFFFGFDRINHIDGAKETLLFPNSPTISRMVMKLREDRKDAK